MLSKVVFGLLALSTLLFAGSADPATQCSPVTIDAFAVVASSSGADQEGSMIAVGNGVYYTNTYYVPLAASYQSPKIFFDIHLTANQSSVNLPALVTYGFTIQLNNVFKANATTNATFFDVGNFGQADALEFNNWRFDATNRTAVNNTVLLNVTEIIVAPVDPNAAPGTAPDVTECNYFYTFIFNNPQGIPDTGAFVAGDPQFKGLRGQSFQVHGVDGGIYNIISDKDMQLNSRFSFLEGPRPCPVMPSTGKVSAACWSHAGSYLSELALKTSGGSALHIVAGEASQGFAAITLDGKQLTVGSTSQLSYAAASSASGSVTVDNAYELTIRSGLFELVIENNDGFVNLRSVYVSAANWPKLAAHGLLGQTWQNKRYGGKIKEVEGDVDDYLIEDDNIFGDAFLFNRFISA